MSTPALPRRTVLAGVGTAVVGALAGCTGDESDTPDDSPESVSRAFVRQSIQITRRESVREFVAETNALLELLHTDVWLRETIERQVETILNATEQRQEELLDGSSAPPVGPVDSLDAEIVAEDLTAGGIDEQFRRPLIPDSVAGRNAVVDVRVEFESGEGDETVPPQRLLVAPEDEQWRVVTVTTPM